MNNPQSDKAIPTIAYCILASFLGIFLFALNTSDVGQFFSILGISLLIAGACLLSGGLLGFLFGIPKTMQQERPVNPGADEQGQMKTPENTVSYQFNTNLEQISDWLTKIIVGVGLTQISTLPDLLKRYTIFTATGLGDNAANSIYAVAILVFYIICGFLISYLWTRLHYAGALREADLAVVGQKLAAVVDKVTQIESQGESDAKALSVVQAQLNPGPGSKTLSQEEINKVVIPATSKAKAQIYYLAQDVRSQNWKDPQTKYIMERTIPIFRALIASDTENKYHLNHGQLGFALKDQRQPDWVEAETELNKAIEIRGPWQSEGWLLYEFNRAICRINQDQAFKSEQGSDNETKIKIVNDLKAASNALELLDIIKREKTIRKWLDLNKEDI